MCEINLVMRPITAIFMLAAIFSDRLLMDTDYKHIPKTDKQLSNWFGEKVRQDKSNFLNFEEFKVWYDNSKKACHYCGLTEEESQKIVRTNKLKSNRFPKDGTHGRGTSRGMWLEIDRYQPDGKYEISNIVLCCYFCNNDKSDIFNGDQYKVFMKDRITFLRHLLTIIAILLFSSCQSVDSDTISESQAKEIVVKQIGEESNDLVEVLEFKKTDGVKQEMFGQKGYLMNFHLKLRFKENAHQYFLNKGSYHFYSDKGLKEKLSQGSMMTKGDFENFKKGNIIEYDDKNLFEKTENGWNY